MIFDLSAQPFGRQKPLAFSTPAGILAASFSTRMIDRSDPQEPRDCRDVPCGETGSTLSEKGNRE
jgi:hypothetical protein